MHSTASWVIAIAIYRLCNSLYKCVTLSSCTEGFILLFSLVVLGTFVSSLSSSPPLRDCLDMGELDLLFFIGAFLQWLSLFIFRVYLTLVFTVMFVLPWCDIFTFIIFRLTVHFFIIIMLQSNSLHTLISIFSYYHSVLSTYYFFSLNNILGSHFEIF